MREVGETSMEFYSFQLVLSDFEIQNAVTLQKKIHSVFFNTSLVFASLIELFSETTFH